MTREELHRRRFGITVESVYFHPSRQGIGCAVLIKTYIKLPAKERLLTALIPLSAGPNKSGADEKKSTEDINISTSHPMDTEWLQVDERSGSQTSSFMPSVKLNVVGSGGELSGVGKTWNSSHTQSYKIKLDPSKEVIKGLPTLLTLMYEDEEGVFYPPSVSILIMVEKCTRQHSPGWFPFLLNLDWTLRVDIHGPDISGVLQRFVAKASKHDGWCFEIGGNFNAHLAKDALEDALTNKEGPSLVGLRLAAKDWRKADLREAQPEGKGKGKAKEN